MGKTVRMKLSDWMTSNEAKVDDFARQIGVHLVTVYKLRAGKSLPSVRVAAAIERATNGAVTAADFVPRQSPETPLADVLGIADREAVS
jgi:DNA-binding transcriptional regulator YdaS (Cro superfamily)